MALHRAAAAGQNENMKLLLNEDPNCANAQDWNGDTALHLACRLTHKKVFRKTVEVLLVSTNSI